MFRGDHKEDGIWGSEESKVDKKLSHSSGGACRVKWMVAGGPQDARRGIG